MHVQTLPQCSIEAQQLLNLDKIFVSWIRMVFRPKNDQMPINCPSGTVSFCHGNDLEFSCKQVFCPGNRKHRYYAEFFNKGLTNKKVLLKTDQ